MNLTQKQIFLRNLSKELKIREIFQSFVSSVSGTPLSEAITRQTYYVNIFKIFPYREPEQAMV